MGRAGAIEPALAARISTPIGSTARESTAQR